MIKSLLTFIAGLKLKSSKKCSHKLTYTKVERKEKLGQTFLFKHVACEECDAILDYTCLGTVEDFDKPKKKKTKKENKPKVGAEEKLDNHKKKQPTAKKAKKKVIKDRSRGDQPEGRPIKPPKAAMPWSEFVKIYAKKSS